MKKTQHALAIIIILIILTFFTGSVQAQVCTGNYLIDATDTSGDIAALSGCTEVTGDLTVEDTSLADLSGLESLTDIGGGLYIYQNSLSSLNGLNNITTVGGDLDIWDNDALTSLNGLENLASVFGEYLIIDNNASLTDLCGLYSANFYGSSLYIIDNNLLSMDTAYVLEAQLRLNGFMGSAVIINNNGSGLVGCGCNGAIEILQPHVLQLIPGDTSGANNDAVPSCAYSPSAPDDLYVFTLDTETMVTASVTGFDTVLYLREVCDDPDSELACNDDNTPPGGYGSYVSETLPPGEYFLIVDGYGSDSGSYQLTVDFGSVLDPGIYGNVSGAVQGGVYMLLYRNSCGSSTLQDYVLTAADGSYSFIGLSNGSYKVKPLKTGYAFSPSEQILDFNNTAVTGVDFISY